MDEDKRASEERLPLGDFIERYREQILQQWEAAVRALPPAEQLDRAALRDHIPVLLDRIAEATARGSEPGAEVPDRHALERMDEGFDLDEVAYEYAVLRECMLRLAEGEARRLEHGGLILLNKAIDGAVTHAVTRYHQARSRTLRALDRISEEALADPNNLDLFLHRMLRVLMETTEAVDAAAILLRDEDVLRVRAAVGIERELEEAFSVRVGEGFAGAIAAERRPRFLRSASTDPLVKSQALRAAGVRALYGVPLLHGDELIGVAHIGSRTAWEFTDDDRQLLRTMAQRVAAMIAQRQLVEERQLILGILGHDLRTPLGSIVLSADALARRKKLGAVEARAVERIARSAARMQRMIRDLTDFSRARLGGGLVMTPSLCDLGEVVGGVVEELRAGAPGREIRLTVRGDTDGEWDQDRVAQLAANLGANALAHGAAATPITLTVDGSDAEEVVLEVHNHGRAIPEELQRRIFEPFVQLRAASGGLGLGLYIVRQIVRAHGGAVDVRSDGDGTTFRARLPRWQPRPTI